MIVALGVASGRPRGVEIDTAFFNGNHAPAIAVQGCCELGEDADARVVADGYTGWRELLSRRDCGPSRRHAWRVAAATTTTVVTHVRLLMFPDGGIARFRLYGHAVPCFPPALETAEGWAEPEVELSAAVMGGLCVACSDERFGRGANLLLPGRGENMGDGWETRRSRAAGHVDWAVVKLGARGFLRRVVVDTRHFRGNFPLAVKIHAADLGEVEGEEGRYVEQELDWMEVVGEQTLGPDAEHEYFISDDEKKGYTHVKMTIIPDGGITNFMYL